MAQYVMMTIISLGIYFVSPSSSKSFSSKNGRKSHSELRSKIQSPDSWNSEGGESGWDKGGK